MKKYSRLTLILIITLGALSFETKVGATETKITDRGKIAIEQIATCINSDGKNELNVLYLIDESGSLKWNDRDNLRVQGIIRSLEQFREVSITKPYFSVNRALTTFGSSFTVWKNWEKISDDVLNKDVDWIAENIPNKNEGQFTDWNKGLKGALSEFQKIKTSNSCNVLVWFTDGGVQVGNDIVTTRNSITEICGSDPLTGKKLNQEGLIDKFRKSGINIQGVLLRNQKYIDDPSGVTGVDISKADSDNELARMSFFLPVVEQSGGVTDGAFGAGGPGTFSCGSYIGAGGVLQIVADAIDIIWPPIQFSCLSENGRIIPIEKNGQVRVDSALTRFTLTAPTKGFTLKNSSNSEIANGRGAAKGQVDASWLNASSSVIQVSGEINEANEVTKPGIWSVTSTDLQRAVFCGFLDLGVTVSAETCYTGELCKYSGVITRLGRKIDFDSFKSVKVYSSQIDGQVKSGSQVPITLNRNSGEFEDSFTPQGSNETANLKINLKVVTETGIEFSLGTIKPIRVIPAGYYPEVSPSPIKSSDFSQNLVGKSGEAVANIVLSGPSRTNGQVCFGSLEVRSDVNPNRISGYVSKINNQDLANNTCFTLLAGSKEKVQLSIRNNQSADGNVSGYIPVTLKSDGREPIDTKIDIQFKTETQIDEGKFGLYLALFMFLGLALPLALLSLINFRNSRLVLDNIYRANIPVVLTASGNFVNVNRSEKQKGSDLLAHDDFSPFSSGKEVVRSKQLGSEILTGKTPKNPFGMLQAQLMATPNLVITSSAIQHSRKKFPSNLTQGALNPSGLVYVTLSQSANEQLKLQNEGNRDSDEPIEGSLTALLSLNSGDPVAQVEYLNTRIMHEGGWLNNLLQLALRPDKVENTAPGKKSRKGKDKIAQISTEVDEWGSSTSTSNPTVGSSGGSSPKQAQPSDKSPGDDWGSSATTSDWDTPGSASGSKEEW
jgi:hypothetical protein